MQLHHLRNLKAFRSGSSFAILVLVVAAAALLSGCATGRAAFKAGNYTEAAKVAADRLARSPKAEKAAEVFLLAYPVARNEWLAEVAEAEADRWDPFRWERVANGYGVLRDLANRAALTPFANQEAIVIDYFNEEFVEAKSLAAKARESAGDELLNTGEMYDAREAFHHFEVAISFAGPKPVLMQKRETALELGTLLVAIDPVNVKGHGVNASLLESALVHDLKVQKSHRFVRFVEAGGPGEVPADYFVSLTVGELSLERVDAEVGRTPFRKVIGEGREGERQREVGAVLFRREKRITANSPANLAVFGRGADQPVFEVQLASARSWVAHWDVLEGDSRAVEGRELHLREPADPGFDELAQLSVEGLVADTRTSLAGYFRNK